MECCQGIIIVVLDGSSIYLAHLGENLLDNRLGHIRALAIGRMHFHIGTRLVYQVDCLVRKASIGDILSTGMNGIFQGILTVGHRMELIVLILQALQYLDSLLLGRFLDVYLLESAHDALALGDVAIELLVSGRADESDVASLQILLEHIGSIRSAIRATACAHNRMYLIEIDNGVAFL